MFKKAIQKWLGIEPKGTEEKKVWNVIGTAPYRYTSIYKDNFGKVIKEHSVDAEAILYTSPEGERKFYIPHEKEFKKKDESQFYVDLLTWEKGGYLPDGFNPIKGPERKEWKIPQGVVAMTRPKKEK